MADLWETVPSEARGPSWDDVANLWGTRTKDATGLAQGMRLTSGGLVPGSPEAGPGVDEANL